MKWLNSLDELLYEVMSWLLFFPVTLWRAVVDPFATMRVVEAQAELPEEEQYAALLSPPLFLTLALLAAHLIATALGQADALIADRHGLAAMVTDTTTALIVRVVVFAGFPLFLATRLVAALDRPLDRLTLRRPFYEQCFPAGVFALGVSIGTSLTALGDAGSTAIGRALIGVALANYLLVEVRWFQHRLGCGPWRALGSVLVAMAQGGAFLLLVGYLLTR